MPEEERLRLQAIADRITLVCGWTEAMTEADFLADLMLRDAAAPSLLVIGETARRPLEDTKLKAPNVPWPAIIALRNRIAHGYETVDHQLVWQVVTNDLPAPSRTIENMLNLPVTNAGSPQ